MRKLIPILCMAVLGFVSSVRAQTVDSPDSLKAQLQMLQKQAQKIGHGAHAEFVVGDAGQVPGLIIPSRFTTHEIISSPKIQHKIDAIALSLVRELSEEAKASFQVQVMCAEPGYGAAVCAYISWLDVIRCYDKSGPFH